MTSAHAATALMMTHGLGRKTLAGVIHHVANRCGCLDDVLTASEQSLVSDFGLPPQSASDLPRAIAAALLLLPEFEKRGIHAVSADADGYPSRLSEVLGKDAPPILFVAGNAELLAHRAVGFCGSRKASEQGLRVGREAAGNLARQGFNIVSGYASGVDLETHRSALEAGGTTAFVLAEGILHFRTKREVASLLTPTNHVVVSEFPPGLPWQARNAMQRNATIIGLSDAMIVIEAGTTGGTFACAEATLKYNHPLFVAHYANPADSAAGNERFLTRGATPLRGNADGIPNVERVVETIGFPRRSRPVKASEQTLFAVPAAVGGSKAGG